MAMLEDIKPNTRLKGVVPGQIVSVIQIIPAGTTALNIVYRCEDGSVSQTLLYRFDEESVTVVGDELPWRFNADADQLRLASEAYRIKLAHLFDPHLAVHTSRIDPLPHQITAVYGEMLPLQPLRFLLADDPGAGKTIMTGLFIKELIIRGDLKRCLVVCPGNLVEQWQDELYQKFQLEFDIMTNDRLEAARTGNAFNEVPLCIARLDKLSRDENTQEKLKASEWDLIVCDEAHKMSATVFGKEVKRTMRYRLGQLLSGITRHFLLLTATPHNGKEDDFQLFMALLDADRFEGRKRSRRSFDIDDLMRRLVKEELLTFEGKKLFPERFAYSADYALSGDERALYEDVTSYVREEFNRAERFANPEMRNTVGFALTILQRRLASSPEAIYQSLRRRRERLEARLKEADLDRFGLAGYSADDFDDLEDAPAEEVWREEDEILDKATAAQTLNELREEIEHLGELEEQARRLLVSGNDSKWRELSGILQNNRYMKNDDGSMKKLIVFTEHRDTLNYLARRIGSLLGAPERVVTIQGGMRREERRAVEESFKNDRDVLILVATDAAGEGINLQRAHLMVNYDLPWNPNRIEQRFGRIHRIGQKEVCHLWNLVAMETREGDVFFRLFKKLQQARETLGGRVFDVLGKVSFGERRLRDLLVEAIRYGSDPEVRARLDQVVDDALDRDYLEGLLKQRALACDVMDIRRVMEIREEMERIEARRLQPHFIEQFFLEAFRQAGGAIRKQAGRRYTITRVPRALMGPDKNGVPRPIPANYEQVTFEKEEVSRPGLPDAALICPGHPLLEAVIDWVMDRYRAVLKQGAVFVDDANKSDDVRLLFYIENAICDARRDRHGNARTVSRQMHFVETDKDGNARGAGYAPYLDYRKPSDDERPAVQQLLHNTGWLKKDVEELAMHYAIEHLVHRHFRQVQRERAAYVEKVRAAVKQRLEREIAHWDAETQKAREKAREGKGTPLNVDNLERRVRELEHRLERRMRELDEEQKLNPMPPVVIGGALVVPASLLGSAPAPGLFGKDRERIERAAMDAVMGIEKALGNAPEDVSESNCGYDVESVSTDENGVKHMRFIEVKGRTAGAGTVTVTRNEIIVAQNSPESFILAIVEVDGETTNTVYLKRPFHYRPDLAAASVNYAIAELRAVAEIVYTSQEADHAP